MLLLTKTLHILALGLWFGAAAFFTIAGVLMNQAFEDVSLKSGGERPLWFPLPKEYNQARPSPNFPDPLRKEQGSRAFGQAVSPLFPWYFGIQAVCAFLATATALTFVRTPGAIHRVRAVILLAALTTVGVGIRLERVVDDLRAPRNNATDTVLTSPSHTADEIATADIARADFFRWHTYSLLVNMVTLLLVFVAMALAAALPSQIEPPPWRKSV